MSKKLWFVGKLSDDLLAMKAGETVAWRKVSSVSSEGEIVKLAVGETYAVLSRNTFYRITESCGGVGMKWMVSGSRLCTQKEADACNALLKQMYADVPRTPRFKSKAPAIV